MLRSRVWRAAIVALVVCLSTFVPAFADPPPRPCRDTPNRCYITKYWKASDADALTVAGCESGYDEHERTGSHYGLFQLSKTYHEQRAHDLGYTWDDMWDPGKNTAVAYDLWLDHGWGPWTCKP